MLTIAVSNNWPVEQFDVNNALLNGELQEVVYKDQPEGFVCSSHPISVWPETGSPRPVCQT